MGGVTGKSGDEGMVGEEGLREAWVIPGGQKQHLSSSFW